MESLSNLRRGYGDFEGLQFSGSDSDGIQQPEKHGKIKRFAVVVLAVTALVATVLFCHGFSAVSTLASEHDKVFIALQEVNQSEGNETGTDTDTEIPDVPDAREGYLYMPCEKLVEVKEPELLESNLGGHGPDDDKKEGIRYKTSAVLQTGEGNTSNTTTVNVGVEINALTNYSAGAEYQENGHNAFNGIHGRFLSILMKSDTHMDISIEATNLDTGLPLTLPYFAITFFDLDEGSDGNSKEYVQGADINHYYIFEDSEVKAKSQSDGSKKFSASKPGTGHDNPKNPCELTIPQKKKGVTLQYLNTSGVFLTLGVDGTAPTHIHRGFTFTLRPSLLCARTKLEDGTIVPPGRESISKGVAWPLMDGVKKTPFMEVPHLIKGPNDTVIIDPGTEIPEGGGKKGGASVQSGMTALLFATTMVAVTWPRGDLR